MEMNEILLLAAMPFILIIICLILLILKVPDKQYQREKKKSPEQKRREDEELWRSWRPLGSGYDGGGEKGDSDNRGESMGKESKTDKYILIVSFYFTFSISILTWISFDSADLFIFILKRLLLPLCLISVIVTNVYNRIKADRSPRRYIIMLLTASIFAFGSAGYIIMLNTFGDRNDYEIVGGQVIRKHTHTYEVGPPVHYIHIFSKALNAEIELPVSINEYRQIRKGEICYAKMITGLFGIVYYEFY